MKGNIKVHFVPQGYEADRVIAGIILSQATKVIIIRNNNRRLEKIEKRVEQRIEEVKKYIREDKFLRTFVKEIDDKNYSVDFFDFIDALKNIEKWISNELSKGNEVSVNISSGNSIVRCALFCVAMKFSVPIYYITPEDYEENPITELTSERLAKGVSDRFIIPKIPLDYLHNIPFEVLDALKKMGREANSITDLVVQMDPSLKKPESVEEKKKLRSKRMKLSKQIELLSALGYVKVSLKGREKHITLTELGEHILKYYER